MNYRRPAAGILAIIVTAAFLLLSVAIVIQGGHATPDPVSHAPHDYGQAAGGKVPLFSLAGQEQVQQFAATPDLGGYAFVLAASKVEKHALEGQDAVPGGSRVIHNGKDLGSFPAVAPASLRISQDGAGAAFTIVLWRKWTLPLYRVALGGQKFSSAGIYTENVEFHDLADPWISPDGSKVAYVISVAGKKRVMINEDKIFEGKEAALHEPWSRDGKHFAFVIRKKDQEHLIVDGQTTASAASIRLLRSPSTYIEGDGAQQQLVVEGNPCFAAESILDAAFAEKGGAAVAFSDAQGRFKVAVLTGDCKIERTLGEAKGWKGIKSLRISPDGKKISFCAAAASGVKEVVGPAAGAPAPCGKSVVMGSVTFAADGAAASWIAADGGMHRLCAGGKDLGGWDRIELPLYYDAGGEALSFFAWKDGNLLKETVALSPN